MPRDRGGSASPKRERRPGQGAANLESGKDWRSDPAGTVAEKQQYRQTRWEWHAYRTLTADGHRYRWGSAWRTWGVSRAGAGRFVVTHIPTGRRLTEFSGLATARRFCERIEGQTDWASPETQLDPVLGPQVNQAAQRLFKKCCRAGWAA